MVIQIAFCCGGNQVNKRECVLIAIKLRSDGDPGGPVIRRLNYCNQMSYTLPLRMTVAVTGLLIAWPWDQLMLLPLTDGVTGVFNVAWLHTVVWFPLTNVNMKLWICGG